MGTSTSKSNTEKIQTNDKKQNTPVQTRLVLIKIPISSNVWERSYNIEATLETIAHDFKNINDMNELDENYYMQWTYNNHPIKMNSTKLKEFMAINNINEAIQIEINQEVLPLPGTENLNKVEPCEIVGKPLFNPFEIFTYEPIQKIMKCKTYNKKLLTDTQLDKLSIESAYCNGNNHLYISGGVNPVTREPIGLFWDINLKENNLSYPTEINAKKNHSMIYVNKKVFLIGGDDESTIYIDTETKNINNLPNLNLKRFEPSLISCNNYLYCFDSARKKGVDKYSLERINLNKLDNPVWEIIYPQISPNLADNVYNQKFFGVVEDFKKNIIFVGGIYDNYSSNNNNLEEKENKTMNTKYNIKKNMMEISDIPFNEISLCEKTFLPLDNKNFFILPNFSKRAPKIVYFSKDKNAINFTSYKSNINAVKKKKINYNFQISSQMKNSLLGLNFDMPGLHKEINLNENKKIDNLVSPTNNGNMNNQILFNSNNNTNNNLNFGANINIGGNDVIIKDMKKELINNNNTNINESNNINKNIDTNININLDGGINHDIQGKTNTNIDNGVNLNIEEPNIKVDINPQLKSTNINAKIDSNNANDNELDQNDIKISMNVNQENNINNHVKKDINVDGDIKVNVNNEIETKNNNKTITANSQRNFVYNRNYRINFHNSVDDPCHTIRKIKVRNRPYPEEISLKMIKLKARQLLLNNY